jgi:hypothetical protein
MAWSRQIGTSMSSATLALLLPVAAIADSHVEQGARGAPVSVAAHVNFKIIIPPVLALTLDRRVDAGPDAQSVAINSNGHSVSLTATAPESDAMHRVIIVNSAAGKSITQETVCALRADRLPATRRGGGAAIGESSRTICTVSMP